MGKKGMLQRREVMRHLHRLTACVLVGTAALVVSCSSGGQLATQPQPDRDASAPAASNPDSLGGGLGAHCNLTMNAGPGQVAFNAQAPDCASRLCIRVAGLAAPDLDPLCSATCRADDDCVGVLRDPNQPNDKGCVTGFTCGVLSTSGSLCCKPICVCKDALAGRKLSIPTACLIDAGNSCSE